MNFVFSSKFNLPWSQTASYSATKQCNSKFHLTLTRCMWVYTTFLYFHMSINFCHFPVNTFVGKLAFGYAPVESRRIGYIAAIFWKQSTKQILIIQIIILILLFFAFKLGCLCSLQTECFYDICKDTFSTCANFEGFYSHNETRIGNFWIAS